MIRTFEAGYIPAIEVRVGMRVYCSISQRWVRVNSVRICDGYIVDIQIGEEVFEVDIDHVWLLAGGDPRPHSPDWMPVHKLTLGHMIAGVDGNPYPVRLIGNMRAGRFVEIEVEGNVFDLGQKVAHNIVTATGL
jgi:hypothetical protein